MNNGSGNPLEFWYTVRLLLVSARTRAAGRRRRQRELLNNRSGRDSFNWGGLGFVVTVLFMAVLNVVAAFVVFMAVKIGEQVDAERNGRVVVSERFLETANFFEKEARGEPEATDRKLDAYYSYEAKRLADDYGGTQEAAERKLRESIRDHGTKNLISRNGAAPGLIALPGGTTTTALLGSLALLWWGTMLVFQGEGVEFDLQRRRHPMWEWLFSHPVSSRAVFFAEMLTPLAANPVYWSAPLFVGFVYGFVYGVGPGILATFLLGVPVSLAAACLGKALEIGVVLRFSPRSRGAMIGIMGWLGYSSMVLLLFGLMALPKVVGAIPRFFQFLILFPWPWLGLFVGRQANGSFSFLTGTLTCWFAAVVTSAVAVRFSVWGAEQGLSGSFGQAGSRPSSARRGKSAFARAPLYRKEFLWFIRDRSAIVQTILIPITIASVQIFNLRSLLKHADGAWNYLCGTGILFGTYFLWILGPKSLSSEGSALWIALTWPKGLEGLLKAKAWLWSMISSGIVAIVLCYAAILFPSEIWKILLVGAGWFFFGRTMAEKSVTLVTITSESGEQQKIPSGRRWAAQLGMLTFSIGVFTQQWNLAIVGIVYSYLTAAAMWENFRARLPYLYDPWSEKLPPPPTLMHAMVSISILVECGAILTAFLVGFSGGESIAIAQAISYGVCASLVSVGVSNFLSERGVSVRDVWLWQTNEAADRDSGGWWLGGGSGIRFPLFLLAGAGAGVVLGLVAHGYLDLLRHIPAIAEILRKSHEQMQNIPGLRISYAVMAIGFAPFAEEYLFRGLLYRALDREWGGWRAVVGSAAFFAIYHPTLAWFPVALLGATNAILFKKTRQLAPAVILHMVYNAVVLM